MRRRAAKPVPRRSRWLTALGALAATASVLAAVAWAQLINIRSELSRAQQTIGALQADQQRLVGSLAQTETMVRLSGAAGRGTIIRAGTGETLVSAVLPQLAAGRTYQLWVISGGGAPVGSGTFAVDAHGYGGLTLNAGTNLSLTADVVAITNEPDGGSVAPTTPVLLASEPTVSIGVLFAPHPQPSLPHPQPLSRYGRQGVRLIPLAAVL